MPMYSFAHWHPASVFLPAGSLHPTLLFQRLLCFLFWWDSCRLQLYLFSLSIQLRNYAHFIKSWMRRKIKPVLGCCTFGLQGGQLLFALLRCLARSASDVNTAENVVIDRCFYWCVFQLAHRHGSPKIRPARRSETDWSRIWWMFAMREREQRPSGL